MAADTPLVCFAHERHYNRFYRDYRVHFTAQDFAPSIYADGTLKHTERGLLIESLAFGRARVESEDKFLNFFLSKFELDGEAVLFEAVMAAYQIFPKMGLPLPREFIPRVGNIHEDYRLACSSFLVKDVEGVLTFGFLLTNEVIYAYYARHATLPGEAFFSSVIPVKRRGYGPISSKDGLDDIYRLGVKLTGGSQGTAEWLIGGERVLFHDRLGYRLLDVVLEGGGNDTLVGLTKVVVGFGHHTYLDHQLGGRAGIGAVVQDLGKTDPNSYIRRSASGLVPRPEVVSYREILPDTHGRFVAVLPHISFAVPKPEPGHYSWGQGVKSLVRTVSVTSIFKDVVPYRGHGPDGYPLLEDQQLQDGAGERPQPIPRSGGGISQIPFETGTTPWGWPT